MDEVHKSCTQRRPHLLKEQRLPRYMKAVEKVILSAKSCQGNFKTILANSRLRGSNFKKVYSVTANVLKYYNYIQKIIDKLQLLEKEKFLRREIASVVIYEMIFAKNDLPGKSKVITTIQAYEHDIFKAHEELQHNLENFLTKDIYIPRYVRVHTLVTTVPYVIKDLHSLGFKHITYDDISEERYLQLVQNLERGSFLIDFHFKDILVFPSQENLVSLDLYKKGHIFLQDKASCIPVCVLNPEPGCAVLDACAAPGMKTVHIASKMENKGILIACERDKSRFESLKGMVQHGAVKICKLICKDFKLLDPNDQAYSNVEYILLDPSCSGSGMVSRMDEVTDTEDSKNKERIMKLAGFQIILLKHALSFPSVKKVVYSTCSVNEEENEYVVHEALNSCRGAFKLVPAMPEWTERGLDSFEFGNLCLRTVPEKHMTNGFFVAMFEKVEGWECRNEVRFPKNGNYKRSTNARDDEANLGCKNQGGKAQLNEISKQKRMNEADEIVADAGDKEYVCGWYKEDRHELEEFEQDIKDNASVLNELNEISGTCEHPNKSMEEEHEENQINFNCDTQKNKKLKRKKKEKFSPSESNEDLQEIPTNMPPEYSFKESTSPSKISKTDNSSSISLKEEKQKRKRHLSLETTPENITENTADEPVRKKKKRKEKYENFFFEGSKDKSEQNCAISIEHEAEQHTECKTPNKIDSQSSEEAFMRDTIQSDKASKKHKKRKSKKHKIEETGEIELVLQNTEGVDAFTQNDNVACKKTKKCKTKKHEIEKTNEQIDEMAHVEQMNISIENDSVTTKKSKKCKSKRQEIEKTDEQIDEIANENVEQMNISIENDSVTIKKTKKHKSKKHEIEKTVERTEEIVLHNVEGMDPCIQEESKKSKKCKSKKHAIEKADDFEITDETIYHSLEGMDDSIQNENAVRKKIKKNKTKKHEIEKTDERTEEIVLYNVEGINPCIQEESKKSKKCKSKKHKFEKTDDFEKNGEPIYHSLEGMNDSIQNENAVRKKNKKNKTKKHEIEKIVGNVTSLSDEGVDNQSTSKYSSLKKTNGDDTKQGDVGGDNSLTCLLPHSEEELEGILFNDFVENKGKKEKMHT